MNSIGAMIGPLGFRRPAGVSGGLDFGGALSSPAVAGGAGQERYVPRCSPRRYLLRTSHV